MTQVRIDELVSTLGLTEMNLESGLFQVVNVSDSTDIVSGTLITNIQKPYNHHYQYS